MASRDEEVTVIRAVNPLTGGGEQTDTAYLVVLSGQAVGRLVRASVGEVTIGRDPDNDIVLEDDGVSRFHAAIRTDDTRTSWVTDLGSTNGTFVETQRVSDTPFQLRDGDRIRVGPATILKYGFHDTVEQQFLSRLYRAATRDGLTGFYKREFFEDHLEGEIAWHRRHDEPLTLLLIDIDRFKNMNDTLGHQAGDAVLKQFSQLLKSCCRYEDVVCRYGGDEFAVVLRRTRAEEGQQLGDRLLSEVRDCKFEHDANRVCVTISVGMVT